MTEEPLYVDPRVGSRELLGLLQERKVPAELAPIQFPYGDYVFNGQGPKGLEPIGVERKRLGDLAQSLCSDRLVGHQLPGLVESYQFRWLLVEGLFRTSATGFLETPAGRDPGGAPRWRLLQPQLRADGLDAWLITLELRGGVRVHWTKGPVESATWLATLYRWWQKPWHEHGGHLSLGAQPDARLFLKSPLTQRLANEIPGIGYEKSEGVAQKFKTVKAMVDAEQREWLTIPGIGKILAERAYRSLREP